MWKGSGHTPVLLLPRRSSASHFHVADLCDLPASRRPLRTSDDRGGKPTYPRPGREHVRGPLANGSKLLTGTGGIRRDERAENGALFQKPVAHIVDKPGTSPAQPMLDVARGPRRGQIRRVFDFYGGFRTVKPRCRALTDLERGGAPRPVGAPSFETNFIINVNSLAGREGAHVPTRCNALSSA